MFPYFDQSEYAVALQNAYRQFPAKGSTLDIDFINNRNRVAGVQGAALDGVTFTRLTTGTYFDATGTMQTAAINAPRFEYDPVSLRPLGLLIEESRANILLNSDTGATQSVTVSATAYTLSFYGTGTVTLSGVSTAGPLVGVGDNTRVTLTFTPTAGTLTLTVSGAVTKWQLEAGNFATSYIPTTSASVTRGADVASMTGANFSSWYSQGEGSVLIHFDSVGSLSSSGCIPFSISDATFNNSMYVSAAVAAEGNNNVFYVFSGGVQQAAVLTGAYLNYARRISAIGLQNNNIAATSDGGYAVVDNSCTLPVVDRMYIGSASWNSGNTNSVNGHISRLTYNPKRLPNNLYQYLSRPTA